MTAPTASHWLQAWYDPVAGLKCLSQHLRFADLAGDNDFRLIACDLEKRMKVYRGTGVSSVHTLLDTPVAMATFYPEAAMPRTPSIAVAAGSAVYVYRNLRPYMKFNLPALPITADELKTWTALWDGSMDAATAAVQFSIQRDGGQPISSRAQDLVALPPGPERQSFLDSVKGKPLVQQTVAVAIDSICRDREGEGEQSSLVVATEASQLLFLDPAASAVEFAVSLPSPAALLSCWGSLRGDHRVSVACRDGSVYSVKDKTLLTSRVVLPTLPVAMVRTDADLWVAGTDGVLRVWTPRGELLWSTPMPEGAPITAMCRMQVKRERTVDCVGVAVEGGEVRVYNGRSLVSTLHASDTVTALKWGQYGRETNCLAMVSRSGALSFQMLKRSANFDAESAAGSSAAAAAAAEPPPLAVPKKTRLALEQAERERGAAVEMHRLFQRSLLKLRLTTAREFVRVLTAEGGAAAAALATSSTAGTGPTAAPQLRLNCSVTGLGPSFSLRIDLHNAGSAPLADLHVTLTAPHKVYLLPLPCLAPLPLLLPGAHAVLEAPVECIHPEGAADAVRVTVTRGPAATASTFFHGGQGGQIAAAGPASAGKAGGETTSVAAGGGKSPAAASSSATGSPWGGITGALVAQAPIISAVVAFPPCVPLAPA